MKKFVVITGGRNYTDLGKVFSTLNGLDPLPMLVVQGGATGADALARKWAKEKGIQCVTFHANWDHFGKPAGPIRNRFMVATFKDTATLLVFPGGTGTKNCADLAKKAGMDIKYV